MSRANFYKCRKKRLSKDISKKFILDLVREVRKSQPRMGVNKVHTRISDTMKKSRVYIGRDRFYDLLRESDLFVPKLPKAPRTTNSRHSLPIYSNKIKDLDVDGSRQVWVSDITYIRIEDGFVYLSLIMDFYSKMIVGYHCSDTLEARGCCQALAMAISSLQNNERVIHHSDRGTQYCSHEYTNMLKEKNFQISMTEKNHCAENCYAERLNGTIKQEFGLGNTFKNIAQVEKTISQAVYLYNYERPHYSLGLKVPAEVHNVVA